MLVLDTNVICELRKPPSRVAPEVVRWASAQDPNSLYLSMVTLYELEVGARRLERRDGFAAGSTTRSFRPSPIGSC